MSFDCKGFVSNPHKIVGRFMLNNQLSIPQPNDYKTRKFNTYCIAKQGQTQKEHNSNTKELNNKTK